MKINLKQPKYIAPILGLPFVIGIPLIIGIKSTQEVMTGEFELKETQGINTAIPEPVIDQNQSMDKMGAYIEYFKDLGQGSDFLMAIEEDSIVNELIKLGYTPNEVRQIYLSNQMMRLNSSNDRIRNPLEDSLALLEINQVDSAFYHSLDSETQKLYKTSFELISETSGNEQFISTENLIQENSKGNQKEEPLHNQDVTSDEPFSVVEIMRSINQETQRAMIRQHVLADSLENPHKYIHSTTLVEQTESDSLRTLENTSPTHSFFNTLNSEQYINKIKAVLDEEVKVVLGSRVKFRLAEELMVDQIKLPAGQILYALVSGFQPQRVLMTINSVVFGGLVIPVDIQIYDQDGLEGLFVPDSKFREIAQDIGVSATPDMRIETPVQTTTDMVFEAVNQAVQTSGDALRRAIAKNKARLKYNSLVYLVPNN